MLKFLWPLLNFTRRLILYEIKNIDLNKQLEQRKRKAKEYEQIHNFPRSLSLFFWSLGPNK